MLDSIAIPPLIDRIEIIRQEMIAKEWQFSKIFDTINPNFRDSARNLIHYLTLRSYDLRDIQENLSSLGISSIGHSERYTIVNLDNILHLLYLLQGKTRMELEETGRQFSMNYPRSKQKLLKNADVLFGPAPLATLTRIMVTLPSEAADDPKIIQNLMKEEVDLLRINCAHDNEVAWGKMIHTIRETSIELNKKCKVYMDLPGPKLRTGSIAEHRKKSGKTKPGSITLHIGDTLKLYRENILGHEANGMEPAGISITLGEAYGDVKVEESIWFDDGKIGGVVEEVHPDFILVRIIQAKMEGSKLREGKGINLPETKLRLPGLTEEDKAILPFIVAHADMVGYSFVRSANDVENLQNELYRLGNADIGIILKIETKDSFDHLPNLLFALMKSPKIGVMIARGDLAVEVGWARIAEVQEQISWLCEAAHVPIIWATQVLDNLARTGLATRAEITDAAMGVRAECVMLNKGPYIVEAVKTLRNIDNRMAQHHSKKMGSLRPLSVASRFLE